MEIWQIKQSDLPFWKIDVGDDVSGWETFTREPFATEQEAKDHREMLIREYAKREGQAERIRVSRYTVDDWRKDLLRAVFEDKGTTLRALSILRNETLADLLKP